jgi:signal transduction histidine kinase/PAS domain-containing protein
MSGENLHSLLRRQIKRCSLDLNAVSPAVLDLIKAVNAAYEESDADRGMLERSLELSSQELLQANGELRAFFQGIPDLMFRIDHEGRILSFKTGTMVDLLRPPHELVGCRIQDVPDPETARRFADAVEQVSRNNTIVTTEYTLVRDNQPQTYEARLVPASSRQIIVIIRNISELSRAKHLRQGQNEVLKMIASGGTLNDVLHRLAQLVESQTHQTSCAVMLMDSSRRTLHCCAAPSLSTPFLQKLQSIPVAEDAGSAGAAAFRNDIVIVPDLASNPIWTKWGESAGEFGVRACFSVPIRAQQGGVLGVLTLFFHAARVPSDMEVQLIEASSQIAGIAIDGKRLSEQVLQSRKMEAFGQLAGGVAHDFNNLLTVIMGNLSLLGMEDLSDGERSVVLKEISTATERARQLTRQLLTFSRRQPTRMQSVDLNEVVSNMTSMLRRLIGEHIQLEMTCAAGGAPIWADHNLIEQAIMNLAVNARDAMPGGGRLRLSTECVRVTPEEARAHPGVQPGPMVRLCVADTGTGISPDHLPHIFEPFFTTKEVGRGTGLGLATVFGVVEQHQGWVEVKSQLNEGTSFCLYLPSRNHPVGEQSKAPNASRSGLSGCERIFLVEDDPAVRMLVGNILRRHGYPVLTACNGPEAIEAWAHCHDRVDLLLTDMVMPGGMTGRDLAECLRKSRPDLKVIYCSGYTDEMLGRDSWLRREDCFLEKPIDMEQLLQRVRAQLDGR